jgi:tetratricopeptide (TPR) repeat protein
VCATALSVCVLAICVTAAPSYAAAPSLEGVYSVGSLGFVEFSTDQGHLLGRYRGGGECGFEPNLIVVSNGAFEEDVFLGQVLVCQDERQGCAPRKSFPVMGFSREVDGARQVLVWVKLESGCTSRATDERRLLFRPATSEELKGLSPRATPAELEEKLKKAIADANDKLEQGSHTAARDTFLIALSYDPASLVALLGLGASQVKLAEYRGAVDTLIDVSRRAREEHNDGVLGLAQYNLACAYSRQGRTRESLAALTESVRLVGPVVADDLQKDADLEPVRGTPEYRKLAAKVRSNRKPPK